MRFFTTANQVFCYSQLPTIAKHCFVVCTAFNYLIAVHLAVIGSWKELLKNWMMVAKKAFVGWVLNFRVHMFKLLKSAVRKHKNFNGMVVLKGEIKLTDTAFNSIPFRSCTLPWLPGGLLLLAFNLDLSGWFSKSYQVKFSNFGPLIRIQKVAFLSRNRVLKNAR